jgi:CRP-like cAMP-binding protein
MRRRPPGRALTLANVRRFIQPALVFELLTFAPGEVIIREGVADEHLYILQAGTLEVQKAGTAVAEIRERGTFLGEISAILGLARSCDVVARTECDVLRLTATIDELIRHDPHITKRLLEAMARRIFAVTEDYIEAKHTLSTFRDHGPLPLGRE